MRGKRLGLLSAVAIASAWFILLKLHQYGSFGIHGELADFESLIWNSLHGEFLRKNPLSPIFLVEHFSPILLLFLPLYALFPHAETLLVVQGSVAALALVPLYMLAVNVLKREWAAIAICLAYFFSRLLSYGLMYDFHMEICYPLFVFSLFLAAERKRWSLFYLFLVLTASVKEDAFIALFGIGVYLVSTGERKHGTITAASSVAALAILFGAVFPALRADLGTTYQFAPYWSGYGNDLGEIARNMLSPSRHVEVIFTANKLGNMFNLFSVYLFLPLFYWKTALFLIVPSWFVLYSSDNHQMNGPIIYYGLLITPLLMCSTLFALRRIAENFPGRGKRLVIALATGVFLVNFGNSRIFKQLRPSEWRVDERFRTAETLIEMIPQDDPVSAQVDLMSHVPVRWERYLLPRGIGRSNYVMFDLEGNSWPLSGAENRQGYERLAESADWNIVEEKDGFALLRRID